MYLQCFSFCYFGELLLFGRCVSPNLLLIKLKWNSCNHRASTADARRSTRTQQSTTSELNSNPHILSAYRTSHHNKHHSERDRDRQTDRQRGNVPHNSGIPSSYYTVSTRSIDNEPSCLPSTVRQTARGSIESVLSPTFSSSLHTSLSLFHVFAIQGSRIFLGVN